MGKKPAHLLGTFMTFYGFDTAEADLSTGQKPYKEKLRFYIDTAAKKPAAVLLSETFGNEVSLSDYATFGMRTRLARAMTGARNRNGARSAKLGFDGSGPAMAYTRTTKEGRAYVFSGMTAREVLTAFVRQGFDDYVSHFGTKVITADQQLEHAALIEEYLTQNGC